MTPGATVLLVGVAAMFIFSAYWFDWFKRLFWLPPAEREIVQIMRGAIAMGPEGWERVKHNVYRMGVGEITLCGHHDWHGDMYVDFIVEGEKVPYPRWRDKRYARKALARWEKNHEKTQQTLEYMRAANRLSGHIAKHQREMDVLDRRVVLGRLLGKY